MEPYHILLPNIHNKLKYRIKGMQYKYANYFSIIKSKYSAVVQRLKDFRQ